MLRKADNAVKTGEGIGGPELGGLGMRAGGARGDGSEANLYIGETDKALETGEMFYLT